MPVQGIRNLQKSPLHGASKTNSGFQYWFKKALKSLRLPRLATASLAMTTDKAGARGAIRLSSARGNAQPADSKLERWGIYPIYSLLFLYRPIYGGTFVYIVHYFYNLSLGCNTDALEESGKGEKIFKKFVVLMPFFPDMAVC